MLLGMLFAFPSCWCADDACCIVCVPCADAFGEFVHFNEFIKANRLKAALQANYPTVLVSCKNIVMETACHAIPGLV